MNSIPLGDGTCCLPRAEGITYLKIGQGQAMVGMLGLDMVFQQLYALGRQPEEATDTELVEMARQFNYIPHKPDLEADYAVVLREAYRRFWAHQAS